ncbi:MAG: type I-C CRISPR-associated protein Cas8c/Csd1 [Bacilli bacterium]|nr:type I-C CRISPR-associated protein Cas8c/Csd1 [Bacilli bacterium]
MSFIKTLADTYDNLLEQSHDDLLPISHSTQNAHIEVTLNENSEMINAEFVGRDNAPTLIPVTEDSASRGNGINPHALCDKLQYVAGDYSHYVDGKENKHHADYMTQLRLWKESEYSTDKVSIIYNYLIKSKIILDLINHKILFAGEDNKLSNKFQTEIKLAVGDQKDAFIRFRVITQASYIDAVWQDKDLIQQYINYYYFIKKDETKFCYVSGKNIPYTDKHPTKILNSGDSAKIISSNDKTNFTFKGRFYTAEEAANVSYEISQKAHNALKWLISNQGKRIGTKTFVLWSLKDDKVPAFMEDTVDFAINFLGKKEEDCFDSKDITKEFNKAISGFRGLTKVDSKLALIGLEAPTTGRMAIIFYREFNGLQSNELINNIEKWHKEASWFHRFKFLDKNKINFYGVPSTQEIVRNSFGTEQNGMIKIDDKIAGNIAERLLPSILDRRKIPRDIVQKLICNAKRPQNYENSYNWERVLTTACALYKKYLLDYEKEDNKMNMNEMNNLDYNCGRLLAVADEIERYSLYLDAKNKAKGSDKENNIEIRPTNAMRYFSMFSVHPERIWGVIMKKISYHRIKLGNRGVHLDKMLAEITSIINPEEFKNATNLGGLMVLGFDNQRQLIYSLKTKNKNKENIEEE